MENVGRQARVASEMQQTVHRRMATLNEKPLHAALKQYYSEPGDEFEVWRDGVVVDIVRGPLLVEIQTRNFAAIGPKVTRLARRHPVRLVYPVARDKWIVRLSEDGQSQVSRRRSPKRGAVVDIFDELISLPGLLLNPNFSLELLLIQEEEIRRHDAARAWRRRGWVTEERRLLGVLERRLFRQPADICALMPPGLAGPFTTADLALALAMPRRLAQRMVYCLRLTGCLIMAGKQGNSVLYARAGR